MTSPSTSEADTGSGSKGMASPGAPGRVFFSYARIDADFVLKIASALRVDGVELWVDQLDIPKGARWDESVEGALKSCACLVVVLSPASVASSNVLDEVYYTLGEEKRVVPILLQACEIPFRLKRIQHIDFTAGYERGYEELLAALTKPSARRTPRPVSPPPVIDPIGVPVPAPVGQVPHPAARGSSYRQMALGAALMFFVLVIIGVFSELGKVEPEPTLENRTTLGSEAAPVAEPRNAEPVQTDSGARATSSTPFAPLPAAGGSSADGAATAPADAPVPAVVDPAPVEALPPVDLPTRVEAPPPVEAAPPAPAPAPTGIGGAEIRDFVASFIGAHNRRDLGQILALYDDRVDYLGIGQGTQAVSMDKQHMYGGWTDIQFRIGSEVEYHFAENQQVAVLGFTVNYVGSSAEGTRYGRVREAMRLRQVGGALKIIYERQPVDQ